VFKPQPGEEIPMAVIKPRGSDLNFYRAVSLATTGHPETLVCAIRHGGIAALAIPGPDTQSVVFSSTFPGLDLIDVCSLGSGLSTPAACGLGKDCILVFVRDVLGERKPVAIKLDAVQGTAYRLMSARGHLFILTSSSFYMFPELASHFLEGQPVERMPTQVREFRIEAVDANLIQDRWLLIVTTEGGVLRFDISELPAQASTCEGYEHGQEVSPTPITRDWATREAKIASVA
jgi:hypothetical protein